MIINGITLAEEISYAIKEEISFLSGRKPCLAVLLVGNNPASHIYVKRKIQACENVGILSMKKEFPDTLTQDILLAEIALLNQNPSVDGILVQLPLPPQIDPTKIMAAIDPEKDIDGFHPLNIGKMVIEDPRAFIPCTPLGILTILEKMEISTEGKHAVILGRSAIVGKPMATLLMRKGKGGNATVTVANRQSQNITHLIQSADILIAAIGQPHFVQAEMIKKGAVVIDVGINRIEDLSAKGGARIVGDVNFETVQHHSSYITPVPGGVGPMTIAMLLKNTLKSYMQKNMI